MKIRRKTFDLILTMGGAVLTVVLVVAGALLMWGYSFANSNVHNQLAQQQIFFPTKAQLEHPAPPETTAGMQPYLTPYAGQQVLTGPQAEAYADHFIAVHLSQMPYGGVYSKVSTAARSATPGSPQAAKLQGLATTVFQGTTLRGLLLEAYAFWKIGQIALIAGIVSFCLAGVMLLLTVAGLVHWRRTAQTVDFPRSHREQDAPVEAAA